MTNNAKMKFAGKKSSSVHTLRMIVGSAMIGSVITGAFLGWIDMSIDIRAVGAAVGALAGVLTAPHFA